MRFPSNLHPAAMSPSESQKTTSRQTAGGDLHHATKGPAHTRYAAREKVAWHSHTHHHPTQDDRMH